MGCQLGKKGLCARYMCIIFSSLGVIFCQYELTVVINLEINLCQCISCCTSVWPVEN